MSCPVFNWKADRWGFGSLGNALWWLICVLVLLSGVSGIGQGYVRLEEGTLYDKLILKNFDEI